MIGALDPTDLVFAFQDFMVHVLTQVVRGQLVLEDKLWRYVKGYIKYFYRLSDLMFSELTLVAQYTTLVPP